MYHFLVQWATSENYDEVWPKLNSTNNFPCIIPPLINMYSWCDTQLRTGYVFTALYIVKQRDNFYQYLSVYSQIANFSLDNSGHTERHNLPLCSLHELHVNNKLKAIQKNSYITKPLNFIFLIPLHERNLMRSTYFKTLNLIHMVHCTHYYKYNGLSLQPLLFTRIKTVRPYEYPWHLLSFSSSQHSSFTIQVSGILSKYSSCFFWFILLYW
jgi:hypothetical protein